MFLLKPSEIFYTQDSINNVFTGRHLHSGKYIGTTLDELADGHTTVDLISRISVKYINGKWFTSDNRRLWVFKNFEFLGGCTYIPVIQTTYIDPRKFTTYNGGKSVEIRRNPGGKWYNRLLTNPKRYQNCLRERLSDTYNSTSSASKANKLFAFQPKSVYQCHEEHDASRTAQTVYTDSVSIPYALLIDGQLSSTVKYEDQTLPETSLMSGAVATQHSSNSTCAALRNYSERVERLVSNTTHGCNEFPNQTVEPSSIEKTAMHTSIEASVKADSNKRSPSPISEISFMNTSVTTLSGSNSYNIPTEEINCLKTATQSDAFTTEGNNTKQYKSTRSRLQTGQVIGERLSYIENTKISVTKEMPLTLISNQWIHEPTLGSDLNNIMLAETPLVANPSNSSAEMRKCTDKFERNNLFKIQNNNTARYNSPESECESGQVTGQKASNRGITTLSTSKDISLTVISESGLNNTTTDTVLSVSNSSNMLKEMRNRSETVERSKSCSPPEGTTAPRNSTQSTQQTQQVTFKSQSDKAKATLPTSQDTSVALFSNQNSLSPNNETNLNNTAPRLMLFGSKPSNISAEMKTNSENLEQSDISVNHGQTTSGITTTPGQTASKNGITSSRLRTDQVTIQSSSNRNTANSPTFKDTSSAVVSIPSLVSPISKNALKNNSPALSRPHSSNISSKIRNLLEIFEKGDLSTTQESIPAHSKSARLARSALKTDQTTSQSSSSGAKTTMHTGKTT
ncbi:hypothetical protein CHS0354_028498 [Potamilus streckersoni]|uniref:Uncharacterized protein n=1 Tax=Potamilus streckersoni TaxID=2493646 RepID=A0AAE0SEW0_9BIVA|nr:hypothetical protein CHS0354_028498 [Potamilus streckersoni]